MRPIVYQHLLATIVHEFFLGIIKVDDILLASASPGLRHVLLKTPLTAAIVEGMYTEKRPNKHLSMILFLLGSCWPLHKDCKRIPMQVSMHFCTLFV